MNDQKPEAVAILDEFAADQQPLTPDQQAFAELQAEAGNDNTALAMLNETASDVPTPTEDQVALHSLKLEVQKARNEVLTHLNANPLVQTREGAIAHTNEVSAANSEGPSWHNSAH